MIGVRQADEERITVWTTLRLLYRPETEANLISERIVKGKALIIPKLTPKVRAVTAAAGILTNVISFVLFLLFLPVLWLLFPAFVAMIAAILTLQELRSSIVDQVRMTPLTHTTIIKGLVGGILTRLNNWRLVDTIWGPASIAVFALHIIVVVIASGNKVVNSLYVSGLTIAMLQGVVGGTMLGASLGVMLAVWQRNQVAVVVSVMATVIFTVAGIAGVMLTSFRSLFPGLLAALTFLITPYLLATGAMNLSRRWIGQAT